MLLFIFKYDDWQGVYVILYYNSYVNILLLVLLFIEYNKNCIKYFKIYIQVFLGFVFQKKSNFNKERKLVKFYSWCCWVEFLF